MKRLLGLGLAGLGLAVAAACGGTTQNDNGTSSSSSSGASGNTSGSSSSSSSGSTGIVNGRVPQNHRAVATPCDGTRPPNEPTGIPMVDGGVSPGGYLECTKNADCTEGKNGRCNGNGHDGWRCTYDVCQTDGDCKNGSVCQCEGGFRADNDVCLEGGCRVDADCGQNGFCSPTLGECGNYTGAVGYFCHQPTDECLDDSDCSAPSPAGGVGSGSCRYNKTVGHWRCETSQCAG